MILFYKWSNENLKWVAHEPISSTQHNLNILKTITFNILFDNWNGKDYKTNIVHSEERYKNTLLKLEQYDADIITLNEVTLTFVKLAEKCEYIKKNYFISQTTENYNYNTNISYDCMILTKLSPEKCYVFDISPKRNLVITSTFNIINNNKHLKISVSAVHLSALSKNYIKRQKEFNIINENLKNINTDVHIIQGDFNFHEEFETDYITQLDFHDAWRQIYNIKENPGYTFDSKKNLMIKEMFYGFEQRQMRLDRVVLSSLNTLKIKNIEIIFDTPIFETTKDTQNKNWINTLLSTILVTHKEQYLFNSDHFGLYTIFEIKN